MKRFLSLFCALSIILSVSAVTPKNFKVLTNKKAQKELKASKAPAKKAVDFKAFEGKTVKKAPAAAKAPFKAKKETFDFTFSSETDEVTWNDYCAEEGWWQIEAENEDYYFSISNNDRESAAGEYAWEDLDDEYTCVWVSDFIYFVDGHCTVTVDETDGLKVNVEGSFTDEDGNIYNVSIAYAQAAIVPGDVDFVAVEGGYKFYKEDNDVYFTFRDAKENVIHFDIVAAEGDSDVVLGKEYTLDDMIANYSNVTFDKVSSTFTSASFVKTIDGDTAKYAAVATDTYGRIFHLSYAYAAPKAEKFDTITAAVTVSKESFYGLFTYYVFTAEDEKNAIELTTFESDYFGTWAAGDDITGAVTPLNGIESEIFSGEVTIAKNDSGFTITGSVLCYNNTEYTLDLTYIKPEATREEVLLIDGLKLYVFDGGWQLAGYNEDSTKFVSVAAYTDEITGNYTEEDLEADYTYVVTDIDEEAYNYFEMLSADLTVQFSEEDSTIIIAGNFLGQNEEDVPLFTMLLKGKIPAPKVSDMTFEIVNDGEAIIVTPSNDEDPWDYAIFSAANFETYYDNDADAAAQAAYDYYGDDYAEPGEATFDLAEMLEQLGEGDFVLIVYGCDGGVTTPAVAFAFTLSAEQGIENIVLTEKVQKVVVDGAVYVIRDNKLYNILGTQVR